MDDDMGIRKMNGAPIDGLSHPHPHDHATPLDQGSSILVPRPPPPPPTIYPSAAIVTPASTLHQARGRLAVRVAWEFDV